MKKLFFVLYLSLVSTSLFAMTPAEYATSSYMASIRNNEESLTQFLEAMPKGGDLHNHESGAAYAENLIKYAMEDDFCINPKTFTAYVDDQCQPQYRLDNAVNDPVFYDQIIDAWSMRHFSMQSESGHDHFFSAFGKFGAITKKHRGEMLAEILERAGKQNESYVELMVTADGNASGRLGKTIGWNTDFKIMRDKLLAADFASIVQSMTTSLNEDEAKMQSLLKCDAAASSPGCKVEVRYLYQVSREQPPEMVFAQLLAGFEGATHDPRIVGLNMVQPEDGTISMRDYKLQMQMIAYLRQFYPTVSVSLHAGELNASLVSREGLSFHIEEAVNTAKANRIGHGVDIKYENDALAFLQTMAIKKVLVEINLSSNAEILGIDGADHPLPLYMQYGVPVTLSTDDEGVSRSNLTHEYQHAVTTFNLDYVTIKKFVRNSLMYAFLPGKALWMDDSYQNINQACEGNLVGNANPSTMCQEFLNKNQKAMMQWDLEHRFNVFEHHEMVAK